MHYAMGASLKLLVITRYYPPDAEIGGKRIAHLMRHLPSFGIEPIVLTADENRCSSRDDSFPMPTVRVERTPVRDTILQKSGRWKARVLRLAAKGDTPAPNSAATEAPSYAQKVSFLRRHLMALLERPDRHIGWYRSAVDAGTRLVEKEGIGAILSSGPPWTCHLIGRELKRKYGIPWITDYRDPWTLGSWRDLEEMPAWRDWMDRRQERSLVRTADRVLSVTREMREMFEHAYADMPASKFIFLPNGFDDALVAPVPAARGKSTQRLILHLGTLYGDRRVDTFCGAVSSLVSTGGMSADSIKVKLVGPVDEPSIVARAEAAAPELFSGTVEFCKPIPWGQAQELLGSSDLLLIFQGSNRLAIPGKFYEYLLSGVPILAITKPGALSAILEETKSGCAADPDSVEEIQSQLVRALDMPIRSRQEVLRTAGRFHFRSLAQQLAGVVQECVHGGAVSRAHATPVEVA